MRQEGGKGWAEGSSAGHPCCALCVRSCAGGMDTCVCGCVWLLVVCVGWWVVGMSPRITFFVVPDPGKARVGSGAFDAALQFVPATRH
jgi:hypothetical protein